LRIPTPFYLTAIFSTINTQNRSCDEAISFFKKKLNCSAFWRPPFWENCFGLWRRPFRQTPRLPDFNGSVMKQSRHLSRAMKTFVVFIFLTLKLLQLTSAQTAGAPVKKLSILVVADFSPR
jgi:hypothetical protein